MTWAGEADSERVQVFGELLAECHRDLFGFIYSMVQHHSDAEDVYQQVALVLWRKFDEFELGTNFAAWATKVAHLTARDFIRTRRRHAVAFSDEVLEAIAATYNPGKAWRSDDTSDALSVCLKKLPPKDRALVEQCYSPGRDYNQIAEQQGRTIGAIYQAISRVRKSLYHCVKRTLAQEAF
ncbi:ECF RNA polymerase sigma factor SigE [Posidoniimonas polymericola]|uniref:ECF RNA polymerase sigma factor SigE n=1 Tax=Posidoniimonas polymericola TaxID=2528002 RepID=A0A5C5YKX0_9BACT|nr:sigma-70 family RNA polymerase sigma factor [Posidoniimonas polymericola]TWT75522.1 ECF RNA polymerase sigma factor SigE [Posidoniimonas polymericola]